MQRQITTLKYCESYREIEGLLNMWPVDVADNKETWAHIDHYQVMPPNDNGMIGVFITWRIVPRSTALVDVIEEKVS